MIASIAITCAARVVTFTPDTSASFLSYVEGSTMPLYLPAVGEPLELHGCDPIYVSVEPSARAREEGWKFQIPGESATHARRGGVSTFDFAVSAASSAESGGSKTITIQRYQERTERRRDLSRYHAASPYKERAVSADPLTVVSMQIKRKLTAYGMRTSSGVRPGRNTRREASWSLAGRTRAQEGIVTSTSLSGIGESACNHAVGSQLIECTQRMAKTQTPHPTTGTFRSNDDLHGAQVKTFAGRAPRTPYGGVLAPDAGASHTQAGMRRQAVSVNHGVGTTPARELLAVQPQYAYGSTVAVDAAKPLRMLTPNETAVIDAAFGLFDVDGDGEIMRDELEGAYSLTAAATILSTVGAELVGSPAQVGDILADFDLVEARKSETIRRQAEWVPVKKKRTAGDDIDGNGTNAAGAAPATPEPEPFGAEATDPEPGPEPEEEEAVAERPAVSISLADFTVWVVELLDKHTPGWTPAAPEIPFDYSESPWGENGGVDKDQPMPTHFRKEERHLTYSQGATPFDDSEETRRAWWHPKGRTSVVGKDYGQPLPRSGFVDTRPEVDNRHQSIAPPYSNEENFVPSFATGKRMNAAEPHS